MRNKLLIIGGVFLFIYYLKKRKDKQTEEIKIQTALKANELTAKETIDIIRLKLNDYFLSQYTTMDEDERDQWILYLTTGLEGYKQQFLDPNK
jgi:hypothetical protein